MKKEGIQTRNRKLSSKSKKKKGMLGFPDMLKPLDKGFGGFGGGGGGFSASMSHYMYGGQMHGSSMTGGFMSGPAMHGMGTMSGLGLGLSSTSQIQIPSASSLCPSSSNSLVGAMAKSHSSTDSRNLLASLGSRDPHHHSLALAAAASPSVVGQHMDMSETQASYSGHLYSSAPLCVDGQTNGQDRNGGGSGMSGYLGSHHLSLSDGSTHVGGTSTSAAPTWWLPSCDDVVLQCES